MGFGELFLKENTSDDDTSMLFGTKDEIQSLLYTLRNIWNDWLEYGWLTWALIG